MTAAESILRAMTQLSHAERSFAWPELVVAVWSFNRKRWSMRGHDLPDTKAIASCLATMRKNGLVRLVSRGRREQGAWVVTEKGLARVGKCTN